MPGLFFLYQSRICTPLTSQQPPASDGRIDTHAADEGRNQGDAGLGAGNGLGKAEEEGEVAVNAVVALELARRLDALPGRRDLDEDALLLDTDGVVQRDELLGLLLCRLLVKGETGVNLGRDTTRDNLQDLLAEFDELHEPRGAPVSSGRRDVGVRRTMIESGGNQGCRRGYSRGGP